MPPSDTSSPRAASPSNSSAPIPPACACRCGPGTASTPSRTATVPRGFRTPSRKVELFSEELADHGYPPLPEFEEPRTSPQSRPELAARFPLVLTCAKSLWFCETQHRNVPSLRRRVPDPQVELHPDTAQARGIAAGDWVRIETPHGSIRARAKLNASLDPQVVCGQHGWWQACAELGLPAYSTVRGRQREPEPGPAPAAQRPDQRQLPAARLGLQRGAADRGGGRPRAPRALRPLPAGAVVRPSPAGLSAAYGGGRRPPDTRGGRATAR